MSQKEGLMETASNQKTSKWLRENDLSDIISICEQEDLTQDLFMQANSTQLQDLCNAYNIGIKYQLKLKSVLITMPSSVIAQESKLKIIYLSMEEKEYITKLDVALKEVLEELRQNEKNIKNLKEQQKTAVELMESSINEIIQIIQLKRKNMIDQINNIVLQRQQQINHHKKACNELKQSFLTKKSEIAQVSTNESEPNKSILIKQIVDKSMNEYETFIKNKSNIALDIKSAVNVKQIDAAIAKFCNVDGYTVINNDNDDNNNNGNNIDLEALFSSFESTTCFASKLMKENDFETALKHLIYGFDELYKYISFIPSEKINIVSVAYCNEAICYGTLNKYDDALIAINKCISIRPNWIVSYFIMAALYATQKNDDQAIIAYKRSLELCDDNDIETKHIIQRRLETIIYRQNNKNNKNNNNNNANTKRFAFKYQNDPTVDSCTYEKTGFHFHFDGKQRVNWTSSVFETKHIEENKDNDITDNQPPPLPSPKYSVESTWSASIPHDEEVKSNTINVMNSINQELNLKKTLIWNETDLKWNKICKASTIKIYKDDDKMMVIIQDSKSNEVKVNHVIPNKKYAQFKYVEEKLSCQWMTQNDLIQKENEAFTVFIKFKSKQTFETFINLFQTISR